MVAIEPARAMLDRLQAAARERGLAIRAVHASAEALPLDDASLDLAVVADALHFCDAQLMAAEIGRVLTPTGQLAVVTCQLGTTPFMREQVQVIEDAVPRRPRALSQNMVHVSAITGVRFGPARRFDDQTPIDADTLERILRSISFIGPAMNSTRFAAFRARVRALDGRPVWARTFTLRAGQRGGIRVLNRSFHFAPDPFHRFRSRDEFVIHLAKL